MKMKMDEGREADSKPFQGIEASCKCTKSTENPTFIPALGNGGTPSIIPGSGNDVKSWRTGKSETITHRFKV